LTKIADELQYNLTYGQMISSERAIGILSEVVPEALDRAGRKGLQMQPGVQADRKTDTGDDRLDLVTEADLALQEDILTTIARTELHRCVLLAEEKTDAVGEFTGEDPLRITLDSINGTKRYKDGSRAWEIVVGAHSPDQILFNYSLSPGLGYSVQIDEDKGIQTTGTFPGSIAQAKQSQMIMARRYDELLREHSELRDFFHDAHFEIVEKDPPIDAIGGRVGRNMAFVSGLVQGVLIHRPNPFDGLLPAHFAKHSGRQVITFGREGNFDGITDLTDMEIHKEMPVFIGGYLALN